MFNARIARIDADYPRSFAGQAKAASDATARVLPPIRVEPSDLARARRVFLVSPTWMFRPATPLWAYVEQAQLRGKEVTLVTTGNSRFEQSETTRSRGRSSLAAAASFTMSSCAAAASSGRRAARSS